MATLKKGLSSFAFRDVRSNEIKFSRMYAKGLLPASFADFDWKDYCPEVFREIRELKRVENEAYMRSICADEVLREVSLPGKAGCLMPLSTDNRFVIRILRKSEMKVILNMLPNYYSHLEKNQASLLTTVYGLHGVKPLGGFKVYLAVVSNVVPLSVDAYKIFHLKASTQGRTRSTKRLEEYVLLKDLDFDFVFYLDPLTQGRLLAQIKRDCEFLEAEGIMDYSFLIGIVMQAPYEASIGSYSSNSKTISNFFTSPSCLNDNRCSNHRNVASDFFCTPALSVDGSSDTATVSNQSLEDLEDTHFSFADIASESDSQNFVLGMGMPAHAMRTKMIKGATSLQSRQSIAKLGSHSVVLYFAIVDIFRCYTVKKRIEHVYKSLQYDPKLISAVNPKLYSSRFQEFLSQIFQADACSWSVDMSNASS